MVRKLYSIADWQRVDTTKWFVLPGRADMTRQIRLELTSSCRTLVSLVIGGEVLFPLAIFEGYELLDFNWHGDAKLRFEPADPERHVSDLSVWYFTNDGKKTCYAVEEPITFSSVHKPRVRDREFERMQITMMRNVNGMVRQLMAQEARHANADPETGEIVDDEPKKPAKAKRTSSGDVQAVEPAAANSVEGQDESPPAPDAAKKAKPDAPAKGS